MPPEKLFLLLPGYFTVIIFFSFCTEPMYERTYALAGYSSYVVTARAVRPFLSALMTPWVSSRCE